MITAVTENKQAYRARNTDYDGLWKNLIEELFQEFIVYFAPDLYPKIDFEKGADFLNLELSQFVIDSRKGRNYVDKLVKVLLRSGEEKYVFVHIEVQAIMEQAFAERMFKYFYRIYDKYNQPVYSIALLTDASYPHHAEAFHYSFYGTELTYAYNTYRFYGKDTEELKKSDHPFALAVLAGIYTSKNKGKTNEDNEERFQFKQQLISLAFEKYSHRASYLSALLYFIDYILQIPLELQEKLYESLPIIQNEKEEGKIMGMEKLRDTPTFGRLFREIEEEATKRGMEKGIEAGMEKAERNFVKKLLNKNYSEKEIAELTSLDVKEVKILRKSFRD